MVVIKAEIKTDAATYIFNMLEAKTLTEAWEEVDEGIRSGMPFKGDELLVIGQGASIKHIRIFEEKGDVEKVVEPWDEPDDVVAKPTKKLIRDTATMVFLGNNIDVDYLIYVTGNRMYFMASRINNEEPFNVLRAKGIKEVIGMATQGIIPAASTSEIVVPPGNLGDVEEYEAFLMDYAVVAEAERVTPTVKGNAKAWNEWHRKGGDV